MRAGAAASPPAFAGLLRAMRSSAIRLALFLFLDVDHMSITAPSSWSAVRLIRVTFFTDGEEKQT